MKFGIPSRPFYAPAAAARARSYCEREGVQDKDLLE